MFDQARAAFKDGRYQRALTKGAEALQLLPGDTTMHEFRALCQFALGKYRESVSEEEGRVAEELLQNLKQSWTAVKSPRLAST